LIISAELTVHKSKDRASTPRCIIDEVSKYDNWRKKAFIAEQNLIHLYI